MKKIINPISLILCMVVLLSSCQGKAEKTASGEDGRCLFLIAGFDDAAENTDVLFTLSYDSSTQTTRIAQIPRDTYINFGAGQNKINQLYASKIARGEDKRGAFEGFVRELELSFGVKFDGYVGINTRVFRKLVDRLGGLDIEIDRDMQISLDTDEKEIILKRGMNHIDGAHAERFVRYRSGYAMGDLGRIDAQKLFLNALFAKISAGMTLPLLLDVAGIIKEEAITNIGVTEVVDLVMDSFHTKGEKTTLYATLPGEPAVGKSGVSYYVLNKKSTAEMLKSYMTSHGEFDARGLFLNADDPIFVNIYEDDSIRIKEYTGKTLSGMHIPANNN